MRYLLDTNIISNLIKPSPSESLIAWMAAQLDDDLYISSFLRFHWRLSGQGRRPETHPDAKRGNCERRQSSLRKEHSCERAAEIDAMQDHPMSKVRARYFCAIDKLMDVQIVLPSAAELGSL